jgi:hypothetical protein
MRKSSWGVPTGTLLFWVCLRGIGVIRLACRLAGLGLSVESESSIALVPW